MPYVPPAIGEDVKINRYDTVDVVYFYSKYINLIRVNDNDVNEHLYNAISKRVVSQSKTVDAYL